MAVSSRQGRVVTGRVVASTVPLRRSSFPGLVTDPRVRAAYAEGAGIYRIVPAGVAVPHDIEELQQLARWAADTGLPLVPRGSGSGMAGGSVGRGVIVDLSQGFRRIAPEWHRRTAWVGASVTWAQLSDAARPVGLRLPPDPSSGAFATSGGMVATNAAGPRSVRCGSVRRWVEGLEIVDASGEIRRLRRGGGSGGVPWHLTPDTRHLVSQRFPKTPKNSSGYALDRYAESGDELDLVIGSEGTLGFVTAVQWRLEPVPRERAGAAFGFGSVDALAEAIPYLLALDPSAVELLDRTFLALVREASADLPEGIEGLLLVEFERDTSAAVRGAVGDAVRGLEASSAHVQTAVDRTGLEKLWAVRQLASPALARLPGTRRSLQVVEDGCVPLPRLGPYVVGIRAAAARHGVPVAIFGHAGDGHVHVNALPDTTGPGWREGLAALFAEATDLLARLGGTPSGEHGDGRLRAGVLERCYGSEVVALWRDLKRAYDPRGILNPGVIIPSADWAPLADLKVGPDAAAIPDDIAARLREIERTAGWATPKLDLARALAP
ncbi:MAG TPA: FAD-binding oxidoreductase [Gemmatimonadales bacterium]|nr:FAD-binding oxidoreductase [Gemmatimonadales bacterium]